MSLDDRSHSLGILYRFFHLVYLQLIISWERHTMTEVIHMGFYIVTFTSYISWSALLKTSQTIFFSRNFQPSLLGYATDLKLLLQENFLQMSNQDKFHESILR